MPDQSKDPLSDSVGWSLSSAWVLEDDELAKRLLELAAEPGNESQPQSEPDKDEAAYHERWTPEFRALGTQAAAKWSARFKADLGAQIALMSVSFASGIVAVGYAVVHGPEMTRGILAADSETFIEQLLALTWPVLVLATLAILAGAGAWMVHVRAVEAYNCSFQALTQYWRDTSVPVQSRELDDQVNFTRRAFLVLMWLARALFIVSLGLFVAAVVDMIVRGTVDASTLALASGSLLSALYGTARRVPTNVANHLADIVQMQTILDACNRQLSLLERIGKRPEKYPAIPPLLIPRAMDAVVMNATKRIEHYAENHNTEDAEDTTGNDVEPG
jgi:hypothetical protein